VKSILITGGASGIGRATAALFADRGWRVGLADVDAATLAATAATLPAERTRSFVMDVRDRAAWARVLAEFTADSAGALDALFNNAGIALGGAFATISDADFDRVVAINFIGVANGARAAHPYLARRRGSCLLNTASASAIHGTAGLATYSATKFAVRALTEALDAEWAADGIKVASLQPGFIDTPLLAHVVPGSNRTAREGVVAAGLEFTPVERVAEAAWAAVHGTRLHWPVGKTARRLTFAARWMPARLRRGMRAQLLE